MMLDLTCTIDCSFDLKPFAIANSGTGTSENLRVVGFEKDGTILFCWDSIPSEGHFTEKVTSLAIFKTTQNASKVIFVHDRCVHIVNACINQERTLAAFTCLESVPALGKSNKENKYENVYKGYVAEIIPQNRMFSLNIESINHIQLHFLYDRLKGHNKHVMDTPERESHMIMLLHRDSIGLYHFPLARAGEGRLIMCNQPRRDQMLKKYTWAQWDPVNQQLYVVHMKRSRAVSKDEASAVIQTPILTCYQFLYPGSSYTIVMEMTLDIQIPKMRSYSRSSYLDMAPSSFTPDASLNLQILSQVNGTLCICYEHPSSDDLGQPSGKRRSSVSVVTSGRQENDQTGLEYSIIMPHHGKRLHCVVPNIPKSRKQRLAFSWINDYLLVFCPGHFTHVLNVGIELEPCHHILCGIRELPKGLTVDSQLMSVMSDRIARGNWLYDILGQKFYKVNIDREKMITAYQQNHLSITAQLAVLHYAVIHGRDISFFKRIIEHICSNDPTSKDIPAIFQEFLVASTYAATKRVFDKDYMRFLPFTSVETLRGYFELDKSGNVVAKVSYSNISDIILPNANKERQKWENMWSNLNRHIQQSTETSTRFNHVLIQKEMLAKSLVKEILWGNVGSDKASQKSVPENTISTSLFRRLKDRAKSKITSTLPKQEKVPVESPYMSRPPSRTEIILGPPPSFLGSLSDMDPLKSTVGSCGVELLCQYLRKFRKNDSHEKARNLATECVKCMMQQAYHLSHVIWSILGINGTIPELSARTLPDETKLFFMYERFYLAAEDLGFPLLPSFTTSFTCLGFRVLDLRLFIQYVDNAVFTLSEDFMIRLIHELDDTINPNNVNIKLQLISRLPKEYARECLLLWNNPITRRYLVQEFVATKLSKDSCDSNDFNPYRNKFNDERLKQSIGLGSGDSIETTTTGSQDSASGLVFPPMDKFIQMLTKNEKSRGNRKHQGLTEIDVKFITDAALIFTQTAGYSNLQINL